MKKTLLAAALLLALVGCSSQDDALSALRGAGYTEITITGYRWTGCGKDDSFHTGFEATGPTGVRVTGVVCSGWLKGGTIRTD